MELGDSQNKKQHKLLMCTVGINKDPKKREH